MYRFAYSICVMLPLTLAFAPPSARAESVQDLILQAGNADDDARRLEILKQLSARDDLEPQLRADVDHMTTIVERWIQDPSLYRWFDRAIQRTQDFDFKIRPDSPLYPLVRFYRARMLVWVTNEYGFIFHYLAERRKFLDKAVADFRAARAAFPANRIIRMYLGEPIPAERSFAAPPGAPAWAALQREGLQRLQEIVHWWIDHRLKDDGQYGGDWDDDCEMWRDWVPVMIAFEDPKIAQAQAFFSRALLKQSYMKGGYTSRIYDVEHTSEPSKDTITPMMHLAPDDPEWQGRAARLAELARTLWTGRNERGLLQFKSTYFSCEKVDPSPVRACDTPMNVLAVEPALLLWQRTGDPRLGELFCSWMDTWVEAAARAEDGKPAGVIPAAVRWPGGAVRGPGPNWWDPRHHDEPKLYEWPGAAGTLCDVLLLAWHMTGRDKYLAPMRSMASIRLRYLRNPPQAKPREGSEAWCAAKLGFLAPTLARYRTLTGSGEFDEILAHDDAGGKIDESDTRRKDLADVLLKTVKALRINFEGYTSEVRFTDRVFTFPRLFNADMLFAEAIPSCNTRPDTRLLYSTATGDNGSIQFFPLNAVRWLTPPRDIAALVTHSDRDRLTAELFHFGEQPRPLQAELYLLAKGSYQFSLTDAEGGIIRPPQPFAVNSPRCRISLELPPGKLCIIKIRPDRQ